MSVDHVNYSVTLVKMLITICNAWIFEHIYFIFTLKPTSLHLFKNILYSYRFFFSGSINLIIVPVGCALSGIVTSPIGRRRAMQMVNVPFFIAWLIFHFSTSTGHLYGALFLTGLAGGLLEAPVRLFIQLLLDVVPI